MYLFFLNLIEVMEYYTDIKYYIINVRRPNDFTKLRKYIYSVP